MKRINVGLVGLGAIGRMHFECWRKCPHAQLAAISARDPRKLAGDWAGQEFNLGEQAAERVDLSGIATYSRAEDLIADANVEVVDVCLPTPLHAPVAIAALRAGKHVFCEKPMSLSLQDCAAMERASTECGRQLMVGHCLRFWPHYVKAQEILASREYGRAVQASLYRSSGAPLWSGSGWFMRAEESGGVLDMHIHDVDVALWWFGRPAKIVAAGHSPGGLPLTIDALWQYTGGPVVHLHSAWDLNGGAFQHGFKLILEKATLSYDLGVASGALQLTASGQTTTIELPEPNAHQAELDEFAATIVSGQGSLRFTPAESRLAVEIGQEELRQVLG